jgi:hypothetical protein
MMTPFVASEVKALFFDVFGTLVDWRSGIAREEAGAVLEPPSAAKAAAKRRLARRWTWPSRGSRNSQTGWAISTSLSLPGSTGQSSNRRPGVLDCPVKPGNDVACSARTDYAQSHARREKPGAIRYAIAPCIPLTRVLVSLTAARH